MKHLYSFACTNIGQSHIISKKPCQDYSTFFENGDMSVVVVSDGHGSSNFTRSEKGSQFACECAISAIKEFVMQIEKEQFTIQKTRDAVVEQLCKNILLRWNQAVNEDFACYPFTEDEVEKVSEKYRLSYLNGEKYEHAYGCTLLILIFTKDYFLAIRNGDGQCVTLNDEAIFDTPIPWNEKCEFNVTTSLCDNDAIEDFRYYYSDLLPVAAFIGSDGVDDSYASVEELFNLYRALCIDAINSGTDIMKENIISFLPGLTKRGSTDDVSIAGVVNETKLNKIAQVLLSENEKRKQTLEEEKNRRIAAIKKREEEELKNKINKLEKEKSELEIKISEMVENRDKMVRKSFFFKTNADNMSMSIDETQGKLQKINDDIFALYNKLNGENIEDPNGSLSFGCDENEETVEIEVQDDFSVITGEESDFTSDDPDAND